MVEKAFVLILSAFSHASWNVLTLVLQPNSEVSVSVELENENNLLSAHSGGRLFFVNLTWMHKLLKMNSLGN